ncbi:MAG TPA: hypothetical protein VH598_11575 [Verrucomicrobiae bacterium]|jgi:hypothetical protein|nr:hypothetical protein [Verrucomicrobiae bacterium]
MNTALQKSDQALAVSTPLGVHDILAQVNLIQQVMRTVMKDKEHYGKIPGCGDKPTLLQPGAQKLLLTFRLAPQYEVLVKDLPGNHREYQVSCTLVYIPTQNHVGQGVGCCSTMEAKYRFRTGPKKSTGQPVPKAYWNIRDSNPAEAQKLIGGKGFGVAKGESGLWEICEIGEKVEHDNPADYYNTVLKMAKKRALVDAAITATAASDIFTQDLEDTAPAEPETAPPQNPLPKAPTPEPTMPMPPQYAKAPTRAQADAEKFWDVICPMPRKGMKKAEYDKHPDTIRSLYDQREDAEIRNRLFGFANLWNPEPREYNGKTYQPSAADHAFRAALDAFLEWHDAQPKEELPLRQTDREQQPE